MAPHVADDIVPGATNAAFNETIPEANRFLKKAPSVVTNGGPVQPPPEAFHYPPYVPQDATYSVLKQYHSKPTKMRVACVGAGASGLCLAYKMERQMIPGSWELTLFDKNPHFGGTWYENTYPGVACDVCLPPFMSTFDGTLMT